MRARFCRCVSELGGWGEACVAREWVRDSEIWKANETHNNKVHFLRSESESESERSANLIICLFLLRGNLWCRLATSESVSLTHCITTRDTHARTHQHAIICHTTTHSLNTFFIASFTIVLVKSKRMDQDAVDSCGCQFLTYVFYVYFFIYFLVICVRVRSGIIYLLFQLEFIVIL